SLDRIVERFGHLAAVREAMLMRADLPAPTRQALVAKLSQTLAGFVAAREWLEEDRAQRIAKEACEKATVTLAAGAPGDEIRPLIRHLRESGQLNAGLVLRALLSGNVDMFEEALAELSGMPLARVSALVHDKTSTGFHALFRRAGLPISTYPAFREAVEALREGGFDPGGVIRLKRRMVERVLTRCADESDVDVEPLLTLLRRFAAEAAREEARMFCEGLVAAWPLHPSYKLRAARPAPGAARECRRGSPGARGFRARGIRRSPRAASGPALRRRWRCRAGRSRERLRARHRRADRSASAGCGSCRGYARSAGRGC